MIGRSKTRRSLSCEIGTIPFEKIVAMVMRCDRCELGGENISALRSVVCTEQCGLRRENGVRYLVLHRQVTH